MRRHAHPDTARDARAELDGRRLRGQARRRRILDAAAHLFRERGFQNVTLEDIGRAAGVTGPAVYRHFRSKDDVLIAALAPAAEKLWAPLVLQRGTDPLRALEAYAADVVTVAVEHPEVIALWYQEWRNLPDTERQAARHQTRTALETAANLLRRTRPELSAAEARVTIDAALRVAAYVNHPGNSASLTGRRLHDHLMRLVIAILRA